jgi:hypothetical protein
VLLWSAVVTKVLATLLVASVWAWSRRSRGRRSRWCGLLPGLDGHRGPRQARGLPQPRPWHAPRSAEPSTRAATHKISRCCCTAACPKASATTCTRSADRRLHQYCGRVVRSGHVILLAAVPRHAATVARCRSDLPVRSSCAASSPRGGSDRVLASTWAFVGRSTTLRPRTVHRPTVRRRRRE